MINLLDEAGKNSYGKLALAVATLWLVSFSNLTRLTIARLYEGVDILSIEDSTYSGEMWNYSIKNDSEELEDLVVQVTVEDAQAVSLGIGETTVALHKSPRSACDYFFGGELGRRARRKAPQISKLVVPKGGTMRIEAFFTPPNASRDFWFQISAKNLRPTTSTMLKHASSARWVLGCLTLVLSIMAAVTAFFDRKR